MKDHDGGDVALHVLLTRLSLHVETVLADLGAIRAHLDGGGGLPFPGELTPEEADFLGHHVALIGASAGLLLTADLARTAAREDARGSRPH